MLDTMKKLDETGQRILFIAPEGKLKAVVTDGDIRKCILRGGALSAPLTQAANYHPHSLPVAERGRARAELQRLGIDALPILDKHGVITDIVFAGGVDVDNRKKVDIPVVMMAGGLGTRLYPYTKILPKPLIPVGADFFPLPGFWLPPYDDDCQLQARHDQELLCRPGKGLYR